MKNVFFILLMILFISHEAQAAAAAGGGMIWDSWFDKMTASITGPVAYALAIFSIVGAGAMLAFGGHEMNAFLRTLIFVFLAIAFIVGAKRILQDITGQGAEIPVTCINVDGETRCLK
jgi:type IV secretion system protein TrbC